MTGTASTSALAPEFNAFLFAPIGLDRNEMLVSVVSALARLDIDPWQEAAQLARLPKAAAALRLAGLIARVPGGPPAQLDGVSATARLVALLPGEPASKGPRLHVTGVAEPIPNYRAVALIVFIVLVLSTQLVLTSRFDPASVAKSGGASAKSAPHKTSSSSGS